MSIAQSEPAFIISALALLFTIISFWYMNWRKGKLVIAPPLSYALAAEKGGLLLMVIPLVFYNSGAASRVVRNLRLMLEQDNIKSEPVTFSATVSDLLDGKFSDGTRQWPRQFAIEGRKSHSGYFEFQKTPSEFVPSQGKCQAIMEAKLDGNKKWEKLCIFYLHIQGTTGMNRFLPYNNDPDIGE